MADTMEGYRVDINISRSEKLFKRQQGRTRTSSVDRQLDTSTVEAEDRNRVMAKRCPDIALQGDKDIQFMDPI